MGSYAWGGGATSGAGVVRADRLGIGYNRSLILVRHLWWTPRVVPNFTILWNWGQQKGSQLCPNPALGTPVFKSGVSRCVRLSECYMYHKLISLILIT